jgi:hypothetical protein
MGSRFFVYNTLSIHTKLTLAGMEDQIKEKDLKEAQTTLKGFLNCFLKNHGYDKTTHRQLFGESVKAWHA